MQHTTTVTVNYTEALQELGRSTYAVIEKAAVGLEAVQRVEGVPRALSGDARIGFNIQLAPRPIEAVRADFGGWILQNAFRDCIEQVGDFLQVVRRMAATVDVAVDGVGEAVMSNEISPLGAQSKAFEKMGFPEKVAHLKEKYGFGEHYLDEMVLSINRARNCLVHRGGVVGEKDCKDGPLVVRTVGLGAFERGADGAVAEVSFPYANASPGGYTLSLAMCPREQVFGLGESVTFTVDDLVRVFDTIQRFAVALIHRLIRFAATRGRPITRSPARNPAPGQL